MTYCFNIFFLIAFLLFQTSIAPNFRLLYESFNLINLFVIYLVLYRPTQEIIIFVILTGILIDSVSACPFGLYLTLYIWISLGIKWILKYLHKGNMFLIPMIITGVILAENIIIMSLMAVIEKNFYFYTERLRSIFVQLVYGIFIGTFLIYLLKDLQAKWNIWSFEKIFKHLG
jgi:cell shape-determining protein MreD